MEIKLNLSKYHRKEDDPLFKDGKLCLYTDTKSEDYPDEVISTFADTLIDYYHLYSLDKIAERMNKFKLHSLNIEINNHLSISFAEIDRYVYVYEEYDMYTDTKIELTEEQKECNVLCGEFNKLYERIRDVIYQKTGLYCRHNGFSYSGYWYVSTSKYSTENITVNMGQKMVSILNDGNIFTIRIENENGELFLPTFTVPEVEYEYLAPFSRYNEKYCNKDIAFTVKPGRNSYVNIFESPYDVEQYLKNINYTGEYRISVTDISSADLSKYVLTNLYISRELIEPLRDDNSVTLSVDKDIRNIDGVINKMLNQQSEIEEHTLSDYVDVFISIGAQGNIFYGLPKDDVFTDNTLFNAIKENIKNTFGLHKDEMIFNKKGKPINIDEVLANVTEKEFFDAFKFKFFHKRYREDRKINATTLNNGCIIHYKPNPFNGDNMFKCFVGKHINVKNIRPFNFDEKQEHIYLLTNLREREYFVKVEKNESGLKIPSFKHCSELFLTAEDCEKYLKEAFENGVDTSGIYFSKLDLNRGDVRGYFKDISTGKLYSEYTEIDYVTPIPMDIKF